jgi:hypothetical protein
MWHARCEAARLAGRKRPSLMAVVARVFGWDLLATMPLWLMGAAGDQAIPWVLNLTLRNIEDPQVLTYAAASPHQPPPRPFVLGFRARAISPFSGFSNPQPHTATI